MPKKQILGSNRKKEKLPLKGPETADEYLASGVQSEEAGEKWRAGDAAKSSRFFVKALGTYDLGLQHFADSFDLAYNKARIQYDLSQHPRLLEHTPWNRIQWLQAALDSHRYALTLKNDDADTLFNTAQVLTSLAENFSDGRSTSPNHKGDALSLFQESLELFQRCLGVQEFLYTQSQQEDNSMSTEPIEEDSELPPPKDEKAEQKEEERWASIVEPVTKDTLLDTMIAQIETLTEICSLLASLGDAKTSWIEDYSRSILEKASAYAEGHERSNELLLARANLACAYADAQFRNGDMDLPTYEREVVNAFNDSIGPSPSPRALCDRADASITLNASIYKRVRMPQLNGSDMSQLNDLRWKHLTRALGDLTSASKMPEAENLAKIHLRRGDCEMLRHRLGEPPTSYEASYKNAATLLKNAETYYRGAAKAAEVDESGEEDFEAREKEAVVKTLNGDQSMLDALVRRGQEKVSGILFEMNEENLLSNEDLERITG